ncbi:DUF2807 domain-containing protein [Occultella glacieicola]|uniref:DUF2807 domain-containing protein n=1 Tax=Occultella glacieicola TaxID=2518684 RepID=A0ABY2E3U1_9MICO|nr:head GIN domain-containing protein [Occultella glacieicola]TDE94165.1 DUF2807 domain-containing protein [Occultella glacieicola]
MHRSRVAIVTAVAGLSLALAGCTSSGPRVTEERDVDADTRAVEVEGSGDLYLEVGDTPELLVTAHERTLEDIRTENRDGVLVLSNEGGFAFFGNRGQLDYEVTLPAVEALSISGAGAIDGEIAPGESLTLDIRGAGDVRIEGVDVVDLTVTVSGAGSVELLGTAVNQSVTIAGAGDYVGGELESEHAVATVSGAGSMDVWVTGTLDATVSGAGDITHTGGAEVTEEINGAGSISGD